MVIFTLNILFYNGYIVLKFKPIIKFSFNYTINNKKEPEHTVKKSSVEHFDNSKLTLEHHILRQNIIMSIFKNKLTNITTITIVHLNLPLLTFYSSSNPFWKVVTKSVPF